MSKSPGVVLERPPVVLGAGGRNVLFSKTVGEGAGVSRCDHYLKHLNTGLEIKEGQSTFITK